MIDCFLVIVMVMVNGDADILKFIPFSLSWIP